MSILQLGFVGEIISVSFCLKFSSCNQKVRAVSYCACESKNVHEQNEHQEKDGAAGRSRSEACENHADNI